MNQEIQQNVIENKKSRMYVPLSITLGYLILISLAYAYVSYMGGDRGAHLWGTRADAGIIMGVNISFWSFIVGMPIILIGSIGKKPFGFIRTWLVNFFVLIPLISPFLFIWLANAIGGRYDKEPLLWITLPSILFAIMVVYLNRKLQKSEAELGITQP